MKAGPRWADRAFWLFLVLVVAAFAAGATIRIDRYATGPSTEAPDGRVVVLVPATFAGSLEPGARVELGGRVAEVTQVLGRTLDPIEVRETYGLDVAVPSVVVETSASRDSSGIGTGRVLAGSEPAIVALVPGLDPLLGGGDG